MGELLVIFYFKEKSRENDKHIDDFDFRDDRWKEYCDGRVNFAFYELLRFFFSLCGLR